MSLIKETHKKLLKGEFSAVELTRSYLKTINEKSDLNAFITKTEDLALTQAKEVDDLISKKKNISELAGIPCAIKDAILVEGEKCTAGSKMLKDYIAPYDATVIKKLKEHNSIIVGKTNMDEFGMGTSNENSAFGAVKNPHDISRVSGGSSGGSAVSVAAHGKSVV